MQADEAFNNWLGNAQPETAERQFIIAQMIAEDPKPVEAQLFHTMANSVRDLELPKLLELTKNQRFHELFSSDVFVDIIAKRKELLKQQVNLRLQKELKEHGKPSQALLNILNTLQKNIFKDQSLLDPKLIEETLQAYESQCTWYINATRRQSMQAIRSSLVPGQDLYQLMTNQFNLVMQQDVAEQEGRFFKSLHRFGESRYLTALKDILLVVKATRPVQDDNIVDHTKCMMTKTSSTGIFGGFAKVMQHYQTVADETNNLQFNVHL